MANLAGSDLAHDALMQQLFVVDVYGVRM